MITVPLTKEGKYNSFTYLCVNTVKTKNFQRPAICHPGNYYENIIP